MISSVYKAMPNYAYIFITVKKGQKKKLKDLKIKWRSRMKVLSFVTRAGPEVKQEQISVRSCDTA